MGVEVPERTKNDLRWRRTERCIMEAFAQEFEQRPVNKISVTGLARMAEINKATFYLHHRDIYDLADAYIQKRVSALVRRLPSQKLAFSDPVAFATEFLEAIEDESFRRFYDLVDENHLTNQLIDETREQTFALYGEIPEPCDPEEAQLGFVFVIDGLFAAALAPTDLSIQRKARVLGGFLEGVNRAVGITAL